MHKPKKLSRGNRVIRMRIFLLLFTIVGISPQLIYSQTTEHYNENGFHMAPTNDSLLQEQYSNYGI